jgi:predicted RNA-binding protein YlqC (UPF0109 family)
LLFCTIRGGFFGPPLSFCVVSITEIEGNNTTVLDLRAAKADMGKIIGKQGRNAQALRTILSAAGGKSRKRYIIEIID